MAATERPLPPGTGQRPQHNNQYSQDNSFNGDDQDFYLEDDLDVLSRRCPSCGNPSAEYPDCILCGHIFAENNEDACVEVRAALELLEAGFSVIPCKADKRPTISSWSRLQETAMTHHEAEQNFPPGARLGVIAGRVSGNLECLDFDDPDTFEPFLETVSMRDTTLPKLLVKRKTPSGGYHLIYRSQMEVGGNVKLAMSQDGKKVRIETRGEGGYFLTSPSPGYSILEHNLLECPTLTADQVKILHDTARMFDLRHITKSPKLNGKGMDNSNSPGSMFNSTHNIEDGLNYYGWRKDSRTTAGYGWTRPGKEKGCSGVLLDTTGNFYCWSSNASPLEPQRSYDAFGLMVAYKHGGDFSAAAKRLGGQDWGKIGKKKMRAEDWTDPPPLVAKIEPEPYPIDALPDIVQKAVEEVLSFTKAPIPLVASSALAAMSVATQAHIDVKRAEKLTGPVSLFALTIADSGERKSTCDKFFTAAIQQYQQEQAELAKPELKDHEAAINAWDAKRSGLIGQIKQLTRKNEPTLETENTLRELEHLKPEPPRVPQLLRGDETPENLAWVLACEWPSGGVVSSEAGVVFGAHGMGKDSIMRNLALLNILWDGGELSIGRRTSESFTVRGARLTIALQVQEATLRNFFERSGDLARGTGFLARFLVAWPESTQGFRPYTDPPPHWPALAAFNQRISEILNTPVPLEEEGILSPLLLGLSKEAKSAWVAFYDAIESELCSGGQLYDVRDVASKVADNAARLAGLFQVFEDGMGGTISSKSFQSASRIAAWHLNEARRFFGELALPEEIKNAILLNDWLLAYCRKEGVNTIPCRTVQQFGPNTLRTKDKLDAALQELESQERLQVIKEGKRKMIQLNLRLLEEVQK